MFLRQPKRKKDGKGHRYFSVVENRRLSSGKTVTRDSFSFQVDRDKRKQAECRDGHYLLRSNLTGGDPAVLWARYVQRTQIEAVFRSLKSELGVRPVYHQLAHRVDAHILVAFLAYSFQVTLKHRLLIHAPGLTPTAVLEKLTSIQMIDVHLPTVDGRRLILPRYTQPDTDAKILLDKLRLALPTQQSTDHLGPDQTAFAPRRRLIHSCGENLRHPLTDSKSLSWLESA